MIASVGFYDNIDTSSVTITTGNCYYTDCACCDPVKTDEEDTKWAKAYKRNKEQIRLRCLSFNHFRDSRISNAALFVRRRVPINRPRVPMASTIRREAFQWKRRQIKRYAR